MRDIILFDLDGTLTPHRQEMDLRVADSLLEILQEVDVGIITGSPIEYVRDQTRALFNKENGDLVENIMVFPCNGTQEYSWDSHGEEFIKVRSTDMREDLGDQKFKELMQTLCMLQGEVPIISDRIPLTGHFISYRQSMINWCPIGRNATNEDRETFVKLNKNEMIRNQFMKILIEYADDLVSVVKGGQTSFDIYPKGWDKTYVLQFADPNDRIWFFGDACQPGGNDHTIYMSEKIFRSFEVSSPEDTINKVKKFVLPEVNSSNRS